MVEYSIYLLFEVDVSVHLSKHVKLLSYCQGRKPAA